MTGPVLIDTGPLGASLVRNDLYHSWAKEQFACIRPPLWTCEAVLAETCYLLRNVSGGVATVMNLLSRGAVSIPFRLDAEVEAVARLLARYGDVPMSLADACLVRMAEQTPGSRVLTLDGDFRVYRMNRRQVVPTVMPEGD